MGNNNATAILTEEESSKLDTNGMSPLGSVSVETTKDQVLETDAIDGDKGKESSKIETNGTSPLGCVSLEPMKDQVFLVGQVRNGDKEKESTNLEADGMYPLGSVSLETMQDQVFLVGEVRNGDKEKESSNLEADGMYPLYSISLETTQDQVFLAGKVRDGDREEESSKFETNVMSPLDSISVETTHDGEEGEEKESFPRGVKEAELESNELVDELRVKLVEEEMHPGGSESLVMVNDEKLQKQTSLAEGVELVCEATEVAELSMIGTQSVVSKSNMTEPRNEKKLCVIDETVFVSPSFCEAPGTEENMVNESAMEESIIGNEGSPDMDSQELLKQDPGVVDDEKVSNEEKAHNAISNLVLQESNVIKGTGRVYREEKDMELEREARMKRMARCRSLPVNQKSRVNGDSLVQQLVFEVTFPLRTKISLEKAKTSESLLTPCEGSNKAQETTESSKEVIEMQFSNFGEDRRIEERSNEATEKTPLLCQDKTEIYKAKIDVEEKTMVQKRSESMKTRGIDESLEIVKKDNDSFKETNGTGYNLLEKKASSGSMKGIVRKRSKSLLLGTCLCCTTTMN